MHWLLKTTSKLGLGCLVLLSAAKIVSVAVSLSANTAAGSEPPPGQVVDLRFQPDADAARDADAPASSPPGESMEAHAFRAATLSSLIFNPYATYPSAPAGSVFASAQGSDEQPAGTAAMDGQLTTGPLDRNVAGTPPVERRAMHAAPPAHAARRSNTLFNEAQIASIRERLRLTPDQQEYWPQVESALRAITFRHHGAGNRPTATELRTIDPNAVEGLKSAAIPLILRLREDQKDEVRKLAHLMGLESVASRL
jgi:hypothetical protein